MSDATKRFKTVIFYTVIVFLGLALLANFVSIMGAFNRNIILMFTSFFVEIGLVSIASSLVKSYLLDEGINT